GDHAVHWSNYLKELVRELPLHYPSLGQLPSERKAGVVAKIGTQFDLRPHMESDRWPQIYAGIQQHLQKIYNGKKAALKERYWVPEEDGTYDLERLRRGRPSYISEVNWDAQLAFWNDPKNLARAAQNKQNRAKSKVMETSATREYPSLIHTFFLTHTVGDDEMLRLQGLGSNTPTGVPYTEDEIMTIVAGASSRGTFSVLVGFCQDRARSFHLRLHARTPLMSSDDKFSQMLTQLESQPEIGGGSGSGGRGDDEQGDDEDDGEDGEDEDDKLVILVNIDLYLADNASFVTSATCRPGIPSTVALNCLTETMWARRCRPGMSPGKESHSSFSVPLIPGDMSPGKHLLFVANNVPYKSGYYLTDGIYPQLAVLIKSIKNPCTNDHKQILYKTKHEAARKDVEQAFGVLKKKWKLIKHPAQGLSRRRLSDVMYTCIILHNMIIQDNGEAISPDFFREEQHRADNPVRTHEESM
ncbi:probable flavin-containing monooxygenase 1, partial [Tanacetum coccineum]